MKKILLIVIIVVLQLTISYAAFEYEWARPINIQSNISQSSNIHDYIFYNNQIRQFCYKSNSYSLTNDIYTLTAICKDNKKALQSIHNYWRDKKLAISLNYLGGVVAIFSIYTLLFCFTDTDTSVSVKIVLLSINAAIPVFSFIGAHNLKKNAYLHLESAITEYNSIQTSFSIKIVL